MKSYRLRVLSIFAVWLLLAPLWVTAAPADRDLTPTEVRVQKALKRLPYYGVFDNIEFQVDRDVVTLSGKVLRASLRSEAAAAVLRLEEISRVDNRIEILPLSNNDDRIRLAALREIYANPMLSRYGAGVIPDIRIIVEHGTIMLEGVVDSEAHRRVAEIEARSVPGAFGVENHLRVDRT